MKNYLIVCALACSFTFLVAEEISDREWAAVKTGLQQLGVDCDKTDEVTFRAKYGRDVLRARQLMKEAAPMVARWESVKTRLATATTNFGREVSLSSVIAVLGGVGIELGTGLSRRGTGTKPYAFVNLLSAGLLGTYSDPNGFGVWATLGGRRYRSERGYGMNTEGDEGLSSKAFSFGVGASWQDNPSDDCSRTGVCVGLGGAYQIRHSRLFT